MLCWGVGGPKFRDMKGAFSRYGSGCVGGVGANISRYRRCCVGGGGGDIHFEIWEVLFRDVGGAVLSVFRGWRRTKC